jgi:small subunit ribosomal protein S6e
MKIVISDPKSGKSFGVELPKDKESFLLGKKIGDVIEGGIFGADGYKLEIIGGSDISGFPMRRDISGPRRLKVVLSSGPGYRKKKKGLREKRNVRGNIIVDEIVQVNLKVVSPGQKPLDEIYPSSNKPKNS